MKTAPLHSISRRLGPLFLLFALMMSAGLAFLAARSLPIPGCGLQDACSEVLGSTWASIAGIPLGLLGGLVYLALLIATRLEQKSRRRSTVVPLLGATVVLAAAWLVGVQAFLIGSFCAWCCATHAVAVIGVSLILINRSSLAASARPPALVWAVPALAVGVLAVLQVSGDHTVSEVSMVEGVAEVIIKDGRPVVSLHDGAFEVDTALLPVSGAEVAAHWVVTLTDPTCEHCRDLHNLMAEADPDTAFVHLPVARNLDARHVQHDLLALHRGAPELFARANAGMLDGSVSDHPAGFRAWINENWDQTESFQSVWETHRAWASGQIQLAMDVLEANKAELGQVSIPQMMYGDHILLGQPASVADMRETFAMGAVVTPVLVDVPPVLAADVPPAPANWLLLSAPAKALLTRLSWVFLFAAGLLFYLLRRRRILRWVAAAAAATAFVGTTATVFAAGTVLPENTNPDPQTDFVTCLEQDGTAPFSASDPLDDGMGGHTPGEDLNGTNGVVRTYDCVDYSVHWNVNEQNADNVVVTLTLPPDPARPDDPDPDKMFIDWKVLPPHCKRPTTESIAAYVNKDSFISDDKKTLVCNLGDKKEGTSGRFFVSAQVGPNIDGKVITMNGSIDTDDSPPNSAPPIETEISSAPTGEWVKGSPEEFRDVTNGVGEVGIVFMYPIALFTGGGLTGSPALGSGPLSSAPTFMYDHMYDLGPNAILADNAWFTNRTACGGFDSTDPLIYDNDITTNVPPPVILNIPYSDTTVPGSNPSNTVLGTVTCTLDAGATAANGYPVVRLDFAGFDGAIPPALHANNGPNNPLVTLTGQIGYFISYADLEAGGKGVSGKMHNVISGSNGMVMGSDLTMPINYNGVPNFSGPPDYTTVTPIQILGNNLIAAERSIQDNNYRCLDFVRAIKDPGIPGKQWNHYTMLFSGPYQEMTATEDPANFPTTGNFNQFTQFQHSEQMHNIDLRQASVGGLGYSSLPPDNVRSDWQGDHDVSRGETVVVKSQIITNMDRPEALVTQSQLFSSELGLCNHIDNTKTELVDFPNPTFAVTDVTDPLLMDTPGDWANPTIAGGGTATASDGPAFHVLAGVGNSYHAKPDMQSGIRLRNYPYVVEVAAANPGVNTAPGQSVAAAAVTCNDADADARGWVDASNAAALAAFSTVPGSGVYDQVNLIRLRSVGPVPWRDLIGVAGDPTSYDSRGATFQLYYHLQVKPNIAINPNGTEIFVHSSRAHGTFTNGMFTTSKPSGGCGCAIAREANAGPGANGHDWGLGPTMGNIALDDPPATSQWCNLRYDINAEFQHSRGTPAAHYAGSTFDPFGSDDNQVLPNGRLLPLSSHHDKMEIVDTRLDTIKYNINGLPLEIVDNGDLVTFEICWKLIGSPNEPANIITLNDPLPANMQYVSHTLGNSDSFTLTNSNTLEWVYNGPIPGGTGDCMQVTVMIVDGLGNQKVDNVVTATGTGDSFGDVEDVHKASVRLLPPYEELCIYKTVAREEGPCDSFPGPGLQPANWNDRCSIIYQDDNQEWTLHILGNGTAELTPVDIIEVFPFLGDAVEPGGGSFFGANFFSGDGRAPVSDFSGTLDVLSWPPVVSSDTTNGNTQCRGTFYWTTQVPDLINRNPDDPSNALVGGIWMGGTPPNLAAVTGFRYVMSDDLTPGAPEECRITFELDTQGNFDLDFYSNTFGAKSEEIKVPMRSPDVSILVHEFDLALTKILIDPPSGLVFPGMDVTFEIEVCNQGGIHATQVEIADFPPPELTLNDPNWTQGAPPHFYTIPAIDIGECEIINITFTVNTDFTGFLTNWSEIASAQDRNGRFPPDTDSTPDAINGNETYGGDNVNDEFGDMGGDEDDHDPAFIFTVDLECKIPDMDFGCVDNPLTIPVDPSIFQLDPLIQVVNRTTADSDHFEMGECMWGFERVYTAVDAYDNVFSCTQMITYTTDLAPPKLTLPLGGSLGCVPEKMSVEDYVNSVRPASMDIANAVVVDECGETTVSLWCDTYEMGECGGTMLRKIRAEDGCGNISMATIVYTLGDQQPDITSTEAGGDLGCQPCGFSPEPDLDAFAVANIEQLGGVREACPEFRGNMEGTEIYEPPRGEYLPGRVWSADTLALGAATGWMGTVPPNFTTVVGAPMVVGGISDPYTGATQAICFAGTDGFSGPNFRNATVPDTESACLRMVIQIEDLANSGVIVESGAAASGFSIVQSNSFLIASLSAPGGLYWGAPIDLSSLSFIPGCDFIQIELCFNDECDTITLSAIDQHGNRVSCTADPGLVFDRWTGTNGSGVGTTGAGVVGGNVGGILAAYSGDFFEGKIATMELFPGLPPSALGCGETDLACAIVLAECQTNGTYSTTFAIECAGTPAWQTLVIDQNNGNGACVVATVDDGATTLGPFTNMVVVDVSTLDPTAALNLVIELSDKNLKDCTVPWVEGISAVYSCTPAPTNPANFSVTDAFSTNECRVTIDRTYRYETCCGIFDEEVVTFTYSKIPDLVAGPLAKMDLGCIASVAQIPPVDLTMFAASSSCSVVSIEKIGQTDPVRSGCTWSLTRTYQVETLCSVMTNVDQVVCYQLNNAQPELSGVPKGLDHLCQDADYCVGIDTGAFAAVVNGAPWDPIPGPVASQGWYGEDYTGTSPWTQREGAVVNNPLTGVAPFAELCGPARLFIGGTRAVCFDGSTPFTSEFGSNNAGEIDGDTLDGNLDATIEVCFAPDALPNTGLAQILWESGGTVQGSALVLDGNNLVLVMGRNNVQTLLPIDLVALGLAPGEFACASMTFDMDAPAANQEVVSFTVQHQNGTVSNATVILGNGAWAGASDDGLGGTNGAIGGGGNAAGELYRTTDTANFIGKIGRTRVWSDLHDLTQNLTMEEVRMTNVCEVMVMRTYTLRDCCGNLDRRETVDTFTLSPDAPTVAVLAPMDLGCILSLDKIPPPSDLLIAASSACAVVDIRWCGDTLSDPETCASMLTRCYEAVDLCGNTQQIEQTINYTWDSEPPRITAVSNHVDYGCMGDIRSIEDSLAGLVTSDDCGIVVTQLVTETRVVNQCQVLVTRTWRVEDACGKFDTFDESYAFHTDAPPLASFIVVQNNCGPFMNIREIEAFDASGNNVALASAGAQAAASSTFNANWPAAEAINGITTQNGEGWHSASQPGASIVIQLAQPTVITQINVLPRLGCCPRLSNYIVSLADANAVAVWQENRVNAVPCNSGGRDDAENFFFPAETKGGIDCSSLPDLDLGCGSAALVPPPTPSNIVVTDLCDYATAWVGDEITQIGCQVTVARSYQVVGTCGATHSCTQLISYTTETLPQFTAGPVSQSYGCTNMPTIPTVADDQAMLESTNPGIIDNTGVVCPTITNYLGAVTNLDACANEIIRTWEMVSDCGASDQFSVTYRWTEAPGAPVITGQALVELGCITSEGLVPLPSASQFVVNSPCEAGIFFDSQTSPIMTSDCDWESTRTYAAVSICNETSLFTQTFTWQLDLTPEILATPAGSNLGCQVVGYLPPTNLDAVVTTNVPLPAMAFDRELCDGDFSGVLDGTIVIPRTTNTVEKQYLFDAGDLPAGVLTSAWSATNGVAGAILPSPLMPTGNVQVAMLTAAEAAFVGSAQAVCFDGVDDVLTGGSLNGTGTMPVNTRSAGVQICFAPDSLTNAVPQLLFESGAGSGIALVLSNGVVQAIGRAGVAGVVHVSTASVDLVAMGNAPGDWVCAVMSWSRNTAPGVFGTELSLTVTDINSNRVSCCVPYTFAGTISANDATVGGELPGGNTLGPLFNPHGAVLTNFAGKIANITVNLGYGKGVDPATDQYCETDAMAGCGAIVLDANCVGCGVATSGTYTTTIDSVCPRQLFGWLELELETMIPADGAINVTITDGATTVGPLAATNLIDLSMFPNSSTSLALTFELIYTGTDVCVSPAVLGWTGHMLCGTETDNPGIVVTDSLTTNGCEVTVRRNYRVETCCGRFDEHDETYSYTETPEVFLGSIPKLDMGCINNVSLVHPPNFTILNYTAACGLVRMDFLGESAMVQDRCTGSVQRVYEIEDVCGQIATTTQEVCWVLAQQPQIVDAEPDQSWGCQDAGFSPPGFMVATNFLTATTNDTVTVLGCTVTVRRVYQVMDCCRNFDRWEVTHSYIQTPEPATVAGLATMDVGCITHSNQVPVPSAIIVSVLIAECNISAITWMGDGPPSALTNAVCGETFERVYTVTDTCGQPTVITQTVTYTVDDQAPSIVSVPGYTDYGCVSADPQPVDTNAVVLTDDNPQSLVLTWTDITNEVDCAVTVMRTWRVVDCCGKSDFANEVYSYTRIPEVTITTPPDLDLGCLNDAAQVPPATPLAVTAAAGGCPVDILHAGDTMTNSGCDHTVLRVYTATNDCGVTASATQTIRFVVDVEEPKFVNNPGGDLGCAGAPPSAVSDLAFFADPSNVSDNCMAVVTLMGAVRSTNGCQQVMTRTYMALDDCGNTVLEDVTYTWVEDNMAPVFNATNYIRIGCVDSPAQFPAPVADNLGVQDDCGLDEVLWISDSAADLVDPADPCTRVFERVYRASDLCGNASTFTQSVEVVFSVSPEILSHAEGSYLGCISGEPDPTQVPLWNSDLSYSTNGIFNVSSTDTRTTNDCLVTLHRVWRVENCCQEFDTAETSWTWTATPPAPSLLGPALIDLGCIQSIGQIPVPATSQLEPVATCGAVVTYLGQSGEVPGDCSTDITRTYQITDPCGGTNEFVQTIRYLLNPAPVQITGTEGAQDFGCVAGEPALPAPLTNVTFTGTPNGLFLEETRETNACSITHTREYLMVDCCGNFDRASVVFTWNVEGDTPVITGVPSIALGCIVDAGVVPLPSASQFTVDSVCGADASLLSEGSPVTAGCITTLERVYQAVGHCGETATFTQTISWLLDVPPTVSTPEGQVFGCSSGDPAPGVDWSLVTLGGGLVVNSNAFSVTHTNGCAATKTVTYNVIGCCGGQVSDSIEYAWTVQGAPPVVTGPALLELGCLASAGDLPVDTEQFTVESLCGATIALASQSELPAADCINVLERVYRATDNCGQTADFIQTVRWVAEAGEPVIVSAPPSQNLGCMPVTVPDPDPASLGTLNDCRIASREHVVDITNRVGCVASLRRIYRVTDVCGKTADIDVIYNWSLDNTPPILTPPAGFEAEVFLGCNPSEGAVNLPALELSGWSASDDCGDVEPVYLGVEMETNGCSLQVRGIIQAADDCGNITQATQRYYYIIDGATPAPTVTPADLDLGCNISSLADLPPPDATVFAAADMCGPITATNFVGDTVTSSGCETVVTRMYEFTDLCGYTGRASQQLRYRSNNGPPQIACPPDTVLGCNPVEIPAPNPANVVASDDCGHPVVEHVSDTVEENGCQRTLSRVYQATDNCGLTALCTQTISWSEDAEPPSHNAPASLDLGCNPTNITAAGFLATDNCGLTTNVTEETTTHGCNVTLTRTWDLLDPCGNTASHVQIITWTEDAEAPLLLAPPDLALGCNPSGIPDPNPGVVQAADACGHAPVIHVSDNLSNNDCARTLVRVYAATDACGNTATVTQRLTWSESDAPPQISEAPVGTRLACNATVPDPDPAGVTAANSCGALEAALIGVLTNANDCLLTVVHQYQLSDACGVPITHQAIWEVPTDDVPPVIDCTAPPALTANALCVATLPDWLDGAVSDNCGIVEARQEPPAGTELDLGNHIVTLTATDACGNTTTCSVPVSVIGGCTPGIELQKTVAIGHDADCAAAVEAVSHTNGAAVTWCFEITNNGTVPLDDVTLTDTPIAYAAGLTGILDPGQSVSLQVNRRISGDLVNTAIVEAEPINGTPSVSDSDPAEVRAAVASLELRKLVVAGSDADCGSAAELIDRQPQSMVTYCFFLTNTGDTMLKNVRVDDPMLGGEIHVIDQLGPGESTVMGVPDMFEGAMITNVATALADAAELPDGIEVGTVPALAVVVPPCACVGGTVFSDLANDGSSVGDNLSTLGLPGVTVMLYDSSTAAPIATTVSDGTGRYLFENLMKGTYEVGLDPDNLPAGFDVFQGRVPVTVDSCECAEDAADLAAVPAPTAVRLESFNVHPTPDGLIFAWLTASEFDTLGYRIVNSEGLEVTPKLHLAGSGEYAVHVPGLGADTYTLTEVLSNLSIHDIAAVTVVDAEPKGPPTETVEAKDGVAKFRSAEGVSSYLVTGFAQPPTATASDGTVLKGALLQIAGAGGEGADVLHALYLSPEANQEITVR